MGEVVPLELVRSKVTDAKIFSPCPKLPGAGLKSPQLPNSAAPREDRPDKLFPAVNTEKVSKAQAVAGTSQPANQAIRGIRWIGWAKMRRLSLADGRRGCQECSCVSSEFISFISHSFQLEFYLLQAVPVTARGRIR